MGNFLSITFSGLSMGMIYAMLAVGLLLLLRAVGVMNFAQGSLLSLGAYTAYALRGMTHVEGIAFPIALMLLFVIYGVVFCMTTYLPLRNNKWGQSVLICTIGAGMVIDELCQLITGYKTHTVDAYIPGSITIGSFIMSKQYILVFLVSLAAMLIVWLLFDKLYAGRAMQAAAQNRYAADLIGIPSLLTVIITYVIVVSIAGIAGTVIAPIFLVRTTLSNLQMRAFCGIVLGGYGQIKGAIIGSILIGLIEAYAIYFTSTYRDLFVFGVLLITLLVRPQGLFGTLVQREKA